MVSLKTSGNTVAEYFQYLSRIGTSDDFIINESDYDNCFFNSADRWLDVGAYIGDFALKHHTKVEWIQCIEPERENYLMLYANMALNAIKNFEHIPALIGTENKECGKLYINPNDNKAKHSTERPRYGSPIEVDVICFDDIIKKYRINKVKMDIEGGEHEILINSNQVQHLDELIFEYHWDDDIQQTRTQLNMLMMHLRSVGFKQTRITATDKDARTAIIHCTKHVI